MKYFVTGATGFIGSAVTKELLAAGHQVLGLARSDKSAQALAAIGAEAHRGSLDDLESLKSGAAASDGVAHLAFAHDFEGNYDMDAWCATDRKAITALGEGLKGSNKPLVITSGILMLPANKLVTEADQPDHSNPFGAARGPSETLVLDLAKEGVKSAVVRLPPTNHGEGDHGFIDMIIRKAKETGFSAYVGEGSNVWAATHRLDTAKAFVLALEKGSAGGVYHAVGEQGVTFKDIAQAVGEAAGVPTKSIDFEEAQKHFGGLAFAIVGNNPASSDKTKKELGWAPTHATLEEDIKGGAYA